MLTFLCAGSSLPVCDRLHHFAPNFPATSRRYATTVTSASAIQAPSPPSGQACGFAALLGPSNSGKSTLLNALVGQKVAIVTPKVQTTRCRVSGIAAYASTQVIYLDTPGIFVPSNRLSRAMVKSAWVSGAQADAVSIVVDAAAMFHEARRAGLRKLCVPDAVGDVMKGCAERRKRGHQADICVCANKMDAVPEGEHAFVLEKVRGLMGTFSLDADSTSLFPISALHRDGVQELVDWVSARMPEGPWLYPADDLTDMPARLLASEVCREKAFHVLKQELPYEIAVETTSYTEKRDGSIRITQDVLVSRDSQKRIVLGHRGDVIKSIGTRTRKDLEGVLGTTVHLLLTVKVRGKWKDDKRQYEQWGLDFNA